MLAQPAEASGGRRAPALIPVAPARARCMLPTATFMAAKHEARQGGGASNGEGDAGKLSAAAHPALPDAPRPEGEQPPAPRAPAQRGSGRRGSEPPARGSDQGEGTGPAGARSGDKDRSPQAGSDPPDEPSDPGLVATPPILPDSPRETLLWRIRGM